MDVMANYALAADSKDYGTMRSLFLDDAKVEMEFDDAFLQGQGGTIASADNKQLACGKSM